MRPFTARGNCGPLYAAMPFARQQIKARVSRETRNLLDAQGYQWVNLAVAGQQVRLSGAPASGAAGEAALLLARQAKCGTWAGPRTCAVEVVADFASPPLAAAAARTAAPTTTPAAVAKACEAGLLAVVARSKIEFACSSALEQAVRGIVIPAPQRVDLGALMLRLDAIDARLQRAAAPPPLPLPPAPSAVRSGSRNLLHSAAFGQPDVLKLIKGVAEVLEKMLHAALDVAHADAQLTAFHGRIERDDWVTQSAGFARAGNAARKPIGL